MYISLYIQVATITVSGVRGFLLLRFFVIFSLFFFSIFFLLRWVGAQRGACARHRERADERCGREGEEEEEDGGASQMIRNHLRHRRVGRFLPVLQTSMTRPSQRTPLYVCRYSISIC